MWGDVNWTCNNYVISIIYLSVYLYICIKSLCCIPQTYTILYGNYISIKLGEKNFKINYTFYWICQNQKKKNIFSDKCSDKIYESKKNVCGSLVLPVSKGMPIVDAQ